MDKKTIIFVGAGILALGAAVGYGVGLSDNRSDFARPGFRADNMSGYGAGWDTKREAGWDTRGDRGLGMMGRDDGYGRGDGKGFGMGAGFGGGNNRMNCYADGCLLVDDLEYPVGTLSDAAKNAVLSALDDEYRARAAYGAIVSKFGAKRPFIMAERSEEQHIAILKSVLDKYGVAIPSDQWAGKVMAPETFQAACQTGVDAETANAALYRDKLLPAVKDYQDITAVFTNLMNASQNNHLPAFDRCN